MLDKLNEWVAKILLKLYGSRNQRLLDEMAPIVDKINLLEKDIKDLNDEELRAKTDEFKKRLEEGETLDDILPEVFAVVRESAKRTIGLRHYDVQLIGGIALHKRMIAEMITGEGKTLVATCPTYLNALTGRGVHIVTVNDYLAKRDRDWMGPVYEKLGLSAGCIQSEMDSEERIKQYACDITFGTNNEFGFDYLRDNMKMTKKDQAQRDLYYAIVDEVDSVLIDEARTPLIISGPSEESSDKYYKADKVVQKLSEGLHYELKEKEQLALLTEDGIEEAERLVGVDSFYKGRNMDWPHHITQALRARSFFKIDKEYVITEGEIVIVDEFTGRPQPGRRWSDGLHQAIEAKEGLKIREENQTLATITLQNYFRLYDKLAGMTGTAATEAMEFDKIYKLEVLAVPPNRELVRKAHDDMIFGTEDEKFNAIVEEIALYHKTGRPLLVGTVSIENSEYLSRLLKRRGIAHQVLNAKYHEKEAQIINRAGELGRVTIATNMAGRGTDIVLGKFTRQELLEHWQNNNLAPKKLKLDDSRFEEKLYRHWAKVFLAETDEKADLEDIKKRLQEYYQENEMAPMAIGEKVADLGGLHVLGTERHDARRIDNQLRGRCGRQGDPGSSRFFLSFQDDMLRKFAPPAMVKWMEKLGMRDGQSIQHPMISRGIEKAQRRVEGYNFEIRKSLLEYDEVMDEQRKIVYNQRNNVLEGKGLKEIVWEMIEDRIIDIIDQFAPARTSPSTWDLEAICEWLEHKFSIKTSEEEIQSKDSKNLENNVRELIRETYEEKEKGMSPEAMRELERYLLLNAIDSKWKDHLHAMDEMRSSIGLVGYAQEDPKIAYKRNGYRMFDEMIIGIKEEVTDLVFRLQFEETDMAYLEDIWQPADFFHQSMDSGDAYSEVDRESWESAQQNVGENTVKTIQRETPKVGRNDPCPCASGKKYKKCCGKNV